MRLLGQFKIFCYFFTKRFCTHKKAQKSTKKHRKAPKSTESTKKHKSATKQQHKTQISEEKFKNALNLFTYLHFCIFCTSEEKNIENKKMKSLYNVMY